jgi:hypothetical protein
MGGPVRRSPPPTRRGFLSSGPLDQHIFTFPSAIPAVRVAVARSGRLSYMGPQAGRTRDPVSGQPRSSTALDRGGYS